MRNVFSLIVISLRPAQWVKNCFIFVALIFSRNVFNPEVLVTSFGAFGIFCLLSGGVYLLNDLLDIEKDRKHPKKCHRPLASGRLSVAAARIALGFILVLSIAGSFWIINKSFGMTALGYLAVQVAYSALLKEIVIVDVFCIAAGFFLRVVAGAEAIDVPISSWLLICTLFISLFLGLGKRRHELLLLGEDAANHRSVLNEYNMTVLDQMVSVVTAGTVISYSLYAFSQETVKKFGTEKLWYTIPIVLYGIFRYLYLVYRKEGGGSPELTLFGDKPLLASIALYAIVVGIILYL
jgi:4-hydroxybenzoate polyprenyltransferase